MASLFTCFIVARTLARVTGWGVAILVGACVLVYVPFSIPSLSYNTIASLGLVSGLFLLVSATNSRRPALDLFLGTLFLSLVTIAYMPLAPVSVAAVLICTRYLIRDPAIASRASSSSLVFSVLLAGILLAIWLGSNLSSQMDLEAVRQMLDLNRAIGMQGGGWAKGIVLLKEFALESVCLLTVSFILFGVANVFRYVQGLWLGSLVLLLSGPALWLASYAYFPLSEPYTLMPFVVILLACAAVLMLRGKAAIGWEEAWVPLRWLCAASILAGLCIAWASANGLRNSALGFFPAALVGLALFSRPRGVQTDELNRSFFFFVAFMVSFLGFGLHSLYGHVYRDSPMSALDAKVFGGAYDGLHTTSDRRDFLKNLEVDLAALRDQSETVFFYDYFPAGYLLSDLAPRTPALWTFLLPTEKPIRHPVREVYARHFQGLEALPDLVVEMRVRLLLHREEAIRPDWDPVRVRLSQGPYEQVLEREQYHVLRKTALED